MPDLSQYLGDGVYAKFDGYQIWVYAHDGTGPVHAIALPNDGTFATLMRFAGQFYPGITPIKEPL